MVSDSTSTRRIIEQYHNCWKAKDLEGILALYADDIEYFDYFANEKISVDELRDYVENALPDNKGNTIRHNDRIRVDGDTGFIQYTLISRQSNGRLLTYQNAEAITVHDGKIVRINEYSSLIKEETEHGESDLQRLGLTHNSSQQLASQLQQLFDEHRPFLRTNLTLTDVAESLGYTRNQISYVLNQHIGKSFYDYLNQARILYFLENTPSEQNLTEAAHACGFSSMSTFYKFFKRHTGQTPGKYFSCR